MANITVTKILENQLMEFRVVISEETTQTQHLVTLNKADYHRITFGDVKPEVLIEKSFEFLLEKEPREAILSEFDFTLINRYFPGFIKEIKKRIGMR